MANGTCIPDHDTGGYFCNCTYDHVGVICEYGEEISICFPLATLSIFSYFFDFPV